MALIARAQTEAFGGPGEPARLSVQFRGAAVPEEEITIVVERRRARRRPLVAVAVTVTQQGKSIVRGASAEIRV